MSEKHQKLSRILCPWCDMYTFSKIDGRCHNRGCNCDEETLRNEYEQIIMENSTNLK